jgi:hypothetical protein
MTIRHGNAREIVRWRKGRWESPIQGTRKIDLMTSFRLIPNINQTHIEPIIDIALRVADDPEKGGIILFSPAPKKLRLPQMGHPWNLRGVPEDIIALIAHDGASICSVGPGEWKHRLLLAATPQALVTLQDLRESNAGRWPLESKGARRWSAAAMALDKNVTAVLGISQDGDIHLWYATYRESQAGNRKSIDTLQFISFPTFGEPKRMRFEKGTDGTWQSESIKDAQSVLR